MSVNRRSVVKGAAWAVPVVAVATAAPALATSGGPPVVLGTSVAGKCPGQSTSAEWTTVIVVQLSASADTFNVPSVTLNGTTYTDACTMPVPGTHNTEWYVVLPSSNSANGHGTGTFAYTASAGGVNGSGTGTISYDGTHPLAKSICETAAGCA